MQCKKERLKNESMRVCQEEKKEEEGEKEACIYKPGGKGISSLVLLREFFKEVILFVNLILPLTISAIID